MLILPDTNEIARAVSILSLLRVLGWRVRNRKRADCGLCRGTSKGTIAFTDRLWHCHRCNEGGDAFSLVRAVNRCDFPNALRFLAETAGISLQDRRSDDFYRELDLRKQHQQRLENAANKLAALEHALLCESRDLIHEAERKRLKVGERFAALSRGEPELFRGEEERLWVALQAAHVLLSAELPVYSLLAFGTNEDRARFVLHPEMRDEIIANVKWAGYIAADGKPVEVMA